MRKKMAKKIKKRIITGLMMMFFFVSSGIALELELNLSVGRYAKADEYFKELYGKSGNIPGAGVVLYLNEHTGLFVDMNFLSARGSSTIENTPLEYKESHFATGLQYRFTVYRFAPAVRVELFFKAGSLFLRYSETFAETFSRTIPGFCFGAGAVFRLKKFGAGFEAVKNYAFEEVEIQGLEIVEKINFSGFRFALKGSYTF
jgi:hypothetical protein